MAKTDSETFGIYCAGETLDDTDISITYIYVSTPLGRIRMTADEAETAGRGLIAAAKYDRRLNAEDDS